MDNDFYILLELVVHLKPKETTLKLGNVEFWQVHDEWCYSIPKAHWNIKSISEDINDILQEQFI